MAEIGLDLLAGVSIKDDFGILFRIYSKVIVKVLSEFAMDDDLVGLAD